jgi:menaquinone-dependent protoporphyrinogen oxidase
VKFEEKRQMETMVLVTYASTHGSTQEVAEVVTAMLRDRSLVVDLQPIRNVRSLDGYRAVVLGVPFYMFHWHKDAHHFLARFQRELTSGLPIAIFAGGPIEDNNEQWQDRRSDLDQELAKFPWLTPVSVQLIGGKFDPAKLRFPYNLIPAMRNMPARDLRDWAAIRAWASDLAEEFQPVAVH